MKRNKIYLIDSENVNFHCIEEILDLGEVQRKIYIFYTKETPSTKWNDMETILKYATQIQPIECFTGPNALDFQLVSFMGTLIGKAPKSEYIIVSNDKGYDACVSFWSKRGIIIHRLAKEYQKPSKQQQANLQNSNQQNSDRKKTLARKQKCIQALEKMLHNEKYYFDLNKISDVFITHNPVKKEIAPALSQSIGAKDTTLFLQTVGKGRLKLLYKI